MIEKFLFRSIPLVVSAFQFWVTMGTLTTWTKVAELELGSFGALYRKIVNRPIQVQRFILFLIILLSALALLAAVLTVSGLDLTQSLLNRVEIIFAWGFLIFLIVAITVQFKLVPRLMLFMWAGKKSQYKHDPDWINARWLIDLGEKAIPIRTDEAVIEETASRIFHALVVTGVDYEEDRANPPRATKLDVAANYWFFGNLIEGQIHRLRDKPRFRFGVDLWEPLRKLAEDGDQLSAESILNQVEQEASVFDRLGQSFSGLLKDVQIAMIARKVDTAARQLAKVYCGNAFLLPFRRLKSTGGAPDFELLRQRLTRLGLSEGMARQFIKLSTSMKLWGGGPESDPKALQFAFSRNVALLFLNLGCLRTLPSVTRIPNLPYFKNLVSWVEARLLTEVHHWLNEGRNKEQIEEFYRKRFQMPVYSNIASELDYFLWHQARKVAKQEESGVFGKVRGTWRFEKEGFSRIG